VLRLSSIAMLCGNVNGLKSIMWESVMECILNNFFGPENVFWVVLSTNYMNLGTNLKRSCDNV
jgi:hypothetical protein